jgi:oligoendopeptidase F
VKLVGHREEEQAMIAPKAPFSEFVPSNLDATRWDAISPLVNALLARSVESAADLERWVMDRSELEAACAEAKADLYITMTCDTEDKQAQAAYSAYIENVSPKLSPAFFQLDKRYVELRAKHGLDTLRYGVYDRSVRADVEIFREENVPLETELAQLGQKFEQVAGAMSVVFEGQERTLPQMARYQELPDRAVREGAWRAVAERRSQDVPAMNDIYEQMVSLRDRIARNAGFENYVGYAFKSMHRFDYTVKDCERFHAGVEAAVVPLVRELEKQRARELKVDVLRPWDLAVDPKGRGPLKPFVGGAELMRKSVRACEKLDGRLGAMLRQMGDGSESRGSKGGACLDLDSRKGKAPGGYQYMRDRTRRPFIFMNAAGLHKDVETMVHEAGHAFHSMLCDGEPLLAYRHSPIEFAEVASMSMELLTMKHWGGADGFYPDAEDFRRSQREQLKRSVLLLPWIATIDAFQHWIYSNPKHTRAQREAMWLGLDARFGSTASWDGIEKYRPNTWQRQLHLFTHPFYYIEYGIAQLGALQLWLSSLEKGESHAVEAYMAGLRLGGSRPLPELFRASGLSFDFGPDMVKRLADRVQAELSKYAE